MGPLEPFGWLTERVGHPVRVRLDDDCREVLIGDATTEETGGVVAYVKRVEVHESGHVVIDLWADMPPKTRGMAG